MVVAGGSPFTPTWGDQYASSVWTVSFSGPRHAGGAESHLGIQRGSASATIGATAEGIAGLAGAPEEGAPGRKVRRMKAPKRWWSLFLGLGFYEACCRCFEMVWRSACSNHGLYFLSCTYFMDVYGIFYASDMQFNLPILYIYAFIKLCV